MNPGQEVPNTVNTRLRPYHHETHKHLGARGAQAAGRRPHDVRSRSLARDHMIRRSRVINIQDGGSCETHED